MTPPLSSPLTLGGITTVVVTAATEESADDTLSGGGAGIADGGGGRILHSTPLIRPGSALLSPPLLKPLPIGTANEFFKLVSSGDGGEVSPLAYYFRLYR